MVPMDDIHIAGEVASTIVSLPETAAAMATFLKNDSLAMIFSFIVNTVPIKTIHFIALSVPFAKYPVFTHFVRGIGSTGPDVKYAKDQLIRRLR